MLRDFQPLLRVYELHKTKWVLYVRKETFPDTADQGCSEGSHTSVYLCEDVIWSVFVGQKYVN
jgi:hypothetical protein